MATIDDLFPGNLGDLEFCRVVLRLQDAEIAHWPHDRPLPPEWEQRLLEARRALRRRDGHEETP